MKIFPLLAILIQTALALSANAAEIIKGKNGSIILYSKTYTTSYEDITKSKDGIYRDLIKTNGVPALLTSGDADIIYTLKEKNGKIFIDCAIAETRSNQTGIPIRKSICDLNKELDQDYAELGYSFTDQWKDEASTIDITPLTMNKKPLDVTRGIIEGIEIHENYKSLSQLENSTPDTYLKKNNECYKIPHKQIFINYSTTNPAQPIGLSALITPEIYELKKYTTTTLKSLKYQKCSEMY
ncbi:hypothetical protein ACFPTX_12875 [Pseudomonas sp. GCM10022188]|uniref:hypothetical protein n=1 Tax=Pseudomonas TaxID=286 RepID=UPI001E514031|nr:hypothetical protein [Pseudomonas oryzagri]MCC6075361.1 hypothetical protein [Pseudomonas oryzagri]